MFFLKCSQDTFISFYHRMRRVKIEEGDDFRLYFRTNDGMFNEEEVK